MEKQKIFVLFDIGMVLVDNGGGALAWDAIAQKSTLGLSGKEIKDLILQTENTYFDLAPLGLISTADFLARLKEITCYTGSVEELGKDFSIVKGIFEERVQIMRRLKNSPDFTVGIVSDTTEIHMAVRSGEIFVPGSSFPEIFSDLNRAALVFSCDPDVQTVKTDKTRGHIPYETALRRLGADPARDRIIMIDDNEGCRAGAEKAGVLFLHLRPGEDLREKLEQIGVPVPDDLTPDNTSQKTAKPKGNRP